MRTHSMPAKPNVLGRVAIIVHVPAKVRATAGPIRFIKEIRLPPVNAPLLCAKARGLPASMVKTHGKGAFLARLEAEQARKLAK